MTNETYRYRELCQIQEEIAALRVYSHLFAGNMSLGEEYSQEIRVLHQELEVGRQA